MLKGRGLKTLNSYQQAFPNYEKTPKAVIAAIAVSFALLRSEDNWDKAIERLTDEWQVLHDNGIVPQKPRQ